MRTPPAGIEQWHLHSLVEKRWGLSITKMHYLAIGAGAHHWKVECASRSLFLTAFDLRLVSGDIGAAFASIESAMSATVLLASLPGLDFVLAPILDLDGHAASGLQDSYAISIFPWIDIEPDGPESEISEAQRQAGLEFARCLREATPQAMQSISIRCEDFIIQQRGQLMNLLAIDYCWTWCEVAERARSRVLRAVNQIHAAFALYDNLVGQVQASSIEWTITHGEPYGGNIIRDTTNKMFLVDWDTIALAPPERDTYTLLTELEKSSDQSSPGHSPPALRLYSLKWDLVEIADWSR